MGGINELFCDYLGQPDKYADFWNGTRFHGTNRLKSKQLTKCDREYHKTQHKPIPKASIRRDVLMRYHDVKDFILGVEIMETMDYTIPIRILDYDAQEFQRQLKDLKHLHNQEAKETHIPPSEPGEFLYGMKKEDLLLPVHTVALYCGLKDYDGKESLLQMTNFQSLASDLQEMFIDYPITIYQLKNLQEENFQTSLREIIAVFKRCQNRNEVKNYYLAHKERFAQMDELAIDTLGALIGKRTLKMFKQKTGGIDMCKAFEEEREEGRLEGKLEAQMENEENLRKAISNLMKNLKLNSIQALEALGIPKNEWEKYQPL